MHTGDLIIANNSLVNSMLGLVPRKLVHCTHVIQMLLTVALFSKGK